MRVTVMNAEDLTNEKMLTLNDHPTLDAIIIGGASKLLGRVALENFLDDWMKAGVRACSGCCVRYSSRAPRGELGTNVATRYG